jgi:hypothetical protein
MKGRKASTASSEEYYTVETILDKKKEDGTTFYLIKWQDFSPQHNSWEPAENLNPKLIKEYQEENGDNRELFGSVVNLTKLFSAQVSNPKTKQLLLHLRKSDSVAIQFSRSARQSSALLQRSWQ